MATWWLEEEKTDFHKHLTDWLISLGTPTVSIISEVHQSNDLLKVFILHWLNISSVQWDCKNWPSWQSGPGCDKLWIVNVWYFQDCWCIIHVSVYNPGVLAPVIYQLLLQDCIKGSRHNKPLFTGLGLAGQNFSWDLSTSLVMGLYFSDLSVKTYLAGL